MKKNNLIFGLIAGAISSIWLVILPMLGKDVDNFTGMLYGYTAMIIGFAMIFVGIKNYRDNFNGGSISFGKAFRTGLYITLIASTVYVITWLLVYNFVIPDFSERMAEKYIAEFKATNPSPEALEKQMAEMKQFGEMYKNPFFNAMITYTEILPVGLIISVIASLILKRRNPEMVAGV
jgi:hypothetical protein